ncbi:MAG: hypothetical protein LR120_04170 [Dehalococcoidia bacterium]|nr:hypothetical protein [Dehalococcoidia bacterium]
MTTRTFTSENADKIAAFTRAIHRAQKLIRENRRSATDPLTKSGLKGLHSGLLTRIVEIYFPAIPDTPEVSVEGVQLVLYFFPAHCTASDLSGIDIS